MRQQAAKKSHSTITRIAKPWRVSLLCVSCLWHSMSWLRLQWKLPNSAWLVQAAAATRATPAPNPAKENASRWSYVGKADTKNHSWLRAVLLIKCFRDAGVTTSVTTRRKSLEAQTTICASIAAQETTVTQTLQALRAFRWRVASSWRLRPLLWRWWNIFSSEWSKNQLKQPKRWLSCIVA